MKKLIYAMFAISFIPAASKVRHPSANFTDRDFSYVEKVKPPLIITEEVDETISTENTTTPEETNEIAVLSSSIYSEDISNEIDAEKNALLIWKKGLKKEDKQLFRKIVRRTKKKNNGIFDLNKDASEKLLNKIKLRKYRKERKAQEQETQSNQLFQE